MRVALVLFASSFSMKRERRHDPIRACLKSLFERILDYLSFRVITSRKNKEIFYRRNCKVCGIWTFSPIHLAQKTSSPRIDTMPISRFLSLHQLRNFRQLRANERYPNRPKREIAGMGICNRRLQHAFDPKRIEASFLDAFTQRYDFTHKHCVVVVMSSH